MSTHEEDWSEDFVIATTADALYIADPDLHETFVKRLLENEKFLAAPPNGPALSRAGVQNVLREIQHLVQYSDFNRSVPQRRILIGLVVATLLRRTQWCHTFGIKAFFLNGQKDPNISMYIKRIQSHLRKCLRTPRETAVRIQILDAEARGRGYEVRFCDAADPALLVQWFGVQPAQLKIPRHNRQGYHGQIALGVAEGLAIRVFARTGETLLDDELPWTIVERSSRKASLLISLLEPADAANDRERDLIEKNRCRLQDRISRLKNVSVSIGLSFHRAMARDLEIAQIGPDYLLVGKDDTFEEIRASRPHFEVLLALLPRSIGTASDLVWCEEDQTRS